MTDSQPRWIEIRRGPETLSDATRREVVEVLERGGVVFLPDTGFALTETEADLLSHATFVRRKKNETGRLNARPAITFDPDSDRILRPHVAPEHRAALEAMFRRFTAWSEDVIREVLPAYCDALERDRVTYRPVERNFPQDLHVDMSYGHPHRGRAMLRLFCNVDPDGRPRAWRVADEPFEAFANRFTPRVSTKLPIRVRIADVLAGRLGVTRGQTTRYDHVMAALRRQAKDDKAYQRDVPQRLIEFPVGSAWIALTDLVAHGAESGKHSLDRTFFLPAGSMAEPERSSLRILERLTGDALV